MKKEDIELIIIKVKANDKEAISLKIYKEGSVYRNGVGGLPYIKSGVMSYTNDTSYFDNLIALVPNEILNKPMNYVEEAPNGYLEYFVAFYRISENISNQSSPLQNAKATGIRVRIDQKSTFNHPIMGFLDGFTIKATEFTNELYFDFMMYIVFNAKSSTLPEKNIIYTPKTKEEIDEDYKNYITQMLKYSKRWDMNQYIQNKTYEIDKITTIAIISQLDNRFNINFMPV